MNRVSILLLSLLSTASSFISLQSRQKCDRNSILIQYERKAASYGQFRAGTTTDGGTYSARFLDDNGLEMATDAKGRLTARPRKERRKGEKSEVVENGVREVTDGEDVVSEVPSAEEIEATSEALSSPHIRTPTAPITDSPAIPVPTTGFNVVLTHCTADFDSLASAVGLAKLWSAEELENVTPSDQNDKKFDSASHVPTFVVLPRGAHPGVQRFLALHKHLFPIRSLKSLPTDLSGLNRLALVDAQRRERIGPAEPLLQYAKRITVLDHHIDQDSDIAATDYVVALATGRPGSD